MQVWFKEKLAINSDIEKKVYLFNFLAKGFFLKGFTFIAIYNKQKKIVFVEFYISNFTFNLRRNLYYEHYLFLVISTS